MEQEILQLIKEKLSAMQAQAIADYVKHAEATEIRCKSAEREIELLRDSHNSVVKEREKLSEKLKEFQNIENREQAVKDSELQAAVNVQKLKGAEEIVSLIKDMFETVFANTQIKREILGSKSISPVQYGVILRSFDKKETRTEE